jgi:hypothetical protein
MPYKKKGSSCVQLKDHKGKPSGLMMEGSVAYMESAGKEKKNLMKDMPIDDKASAMEMSPYKLTEKDKPEPKPFVDPGAPEGFAADAADVGEAASKKFFKSQDIVNRAVQTLEGIDAGKGTYTGYANSDQTVRNALLGGMRKDKLTTQQLKSLSKSDPVKGREYISQNISNASLGDAKRAFDRSYNPFKQS